MRYFLSEDPSGHWYVIPEYRRSEWDRWCELPEDDEDSWDSPPWASRLMGSPSNITFTNPLFGDDIDAASRHFDIERGAIR